jgi:hypothetical protein
VIRRLALILLFALPVVAQDHAHMHHGGGASASEAVVMSPASGTSVEPQAEARPMTMFQSGSWMVMLHGLAFLNDTRATGFRGERGTFSTNWLMGMATRPAAGGTLMLRAMLSAEPFTVRDRRYPELFQTGETAYGKGIIDGQHPHDLFMELAAEYAHPVGRGVGYVYLAPVGDPALGPVAFPHRQSALEIPQAVLSHHWQDSTHIATNVVTAGWALPRVRFEASAFHGAEPDENRTNIDGGRIDSASARVTFTPTPHLVAQASFGYLTHPEALEPGDAKRTTASVSYARGGWTSTVAWGRIYKESHDQSLRAYLAESVFRLGRHSLAARLEDAEKDELFPHVHTGGVVTHPAFPVPAFRVQSATLGYTLDVVTRGALRVGIGGNTTWYHFPEILQVFYGQHPRSRMLYVRTRWGV